MESYKDLFTELNRQLLESNDSEFYCDISDEIKDAYENYLGSEDWRLKRNERMLIDKNKCTKCGSGKNLIVHHLSYKNIGDEKMDDLITVCNSCHRKIHKHE